MNENVDWIKKTMLSNNCVEVCYVETDKTGVYVIKETMDKDGKTIERISDIILDFPIELLEIKRIKELDTPYGKYGGDIYRININGKEYVNSVTQIRLKILKKVVNQPFYSKYGFKFRNYIGIALRVQERKLNVQINK